MKKKFETNVATEIPKTRQEPGLPWKLDSDDLAPIESQAEEYRAVAAGTPPLKTRAIFLITLVLAIFALTSYLIFTAIIENERMRTNMHNKEKEMQSLQTNLEKAVNEKNSLSQNSAQLERRVHELSAQKELFTSVIESLTRKGDEVEGDKKESPKPSTGQSQ